jgi:hypothetical protein
MNQPTHAMLAVEAYRKIKKVSETEAGKKKKLDGLARLLGENLQDVVVAAWLPDSLIKDMMYGHVFKNSIYEGDQVKRFTLSKKDLTAFIAQDAEIPKVAFDLVSEPWWNQAFRVKTNGGHLPARVNALSQTVRDMFKMGDKDVVALTEFEPEGAKPIADSLLYSPRNISMMLWMMSHYVADAHMPFHSDNRGLASTSKQKTHGEVEDLWGKQVPEAFHSGKILKKTHDDILETPLPNGSKFANLNYGDTIKPLKNAGDPWKECVFMCRAGFATSFALVPPEIAAADSNTKVSLSDILTKDWCGEERFWDISKAIMIDSASAIAMFWQDAWWDFIQGAEKKDE